MAPSTTGRHKAPAIFIFDLEGTCVDLEAFHFLAFERAMRSLSVALTADEISAIPGAIGGGDPYIARALARRSNVPYGVVIEQKLRHFAILLRDQKQILPRTGVVNVIERLVRLEYPVGLGSLTPRSRGETLLQQSGLDCFFDPALAIFREDVALPKPDPEVYRRTAERHGIAPDSQIVFEDSAVGVRAARAAGSRAIGVPAPMFQETEHITALYDAGAEVVYESWNDVELEDVLPSLREVTRSA